MNQQMKAELGKLLLKMKQTTFFQPNADELAITSIAEAKKLIEYNGPSRNQGVKQLDPSELYFHATASANAHFVLAGGGQELLLRVPEAKLKAGKFLLADESFILDKAPWKYIVTFGIAIITVIVAELVKWWFKSM